MIVLGVGQNTRALGSCVCSWQFARAIPGGRRECRKDAHTETLMRVQLAMHWRVPAVSQWLPAVGVCPRQGPRFYTPVVSYEDVLHVTDACWQLRLTYSFQGLIARM